MTSTESNTNIEFNCGINETSEDIKIQQIYEETLICNGCSKVLPLDRQENISNARKKSRESLGKQAGKLLQLSNENFSDVQVGTTVRVLIPGVDRARGSPRTKKGALKQKYTRSEFNPCLENFILLENLNDDIKNGKKYHLEKL
nr:unnamed protein product [Callosobruchus analis]